MRVLQFIASEEWGGAETSFAQLCNSMAEAAEVSVVVPRVNHVEAALDSGLPVYRLRRRGRNNPLLYVELARLVARLRPDVVHAHAAKAATIMERLSPVVRIPWVGTKRNARGGRVFGRIRHATAISQAVAASIGRPDVRIIYNGIAPRELGPVPASRPGFRVLAVGRLDPIKRFDALIRAAAELEFRWSLELAGDGEESGRLLALAAELGVADRVHLLGIRDDVPELMAAADVVVIPSQSEGFTRVVLEGLFYARAVISTRVGGAVEVLPDPLLFELDRLPAMLRAVHTRPETYQAEFAAVAAAHRDRFRLETITRQYLEYYREVLGGGLSPRPG